MIQMAAKLEGQHAFKRQGTRLVLCQNKTLAVVCFPLTPGFLHPLKYLPGLGEYLNW